MVRRRTRGERPIHPTRTALIDTTVRLLDEKPADQLTCDEVLEAAGISRGSLYHHFESYPDLVEHAMVARFARHVDESIEALTQTFEESSSSQEFRERLRALTALTQLPDRAPRRMDRVVAFANTFNSPGYRALLGAEQERQTRALADLVEAAQARDWLASELDPRALAVLIQAYTLGRVVDDVASRHVDPDAWVALINRMLDRTLFSD